MTEPLLAEAVEAALDAPSGGSDASRHWLGLLSLGRKIDAGVGESSTDADTLEGILSKSVLRSLLAALHYRDGRTVRHSRRVAMLATGMAQYLGWEGRQLKLLEVAALLHDIGKIGVPDNVLFKPGKLSPDERELMALHHDVGLVVLQVCQVDREVIDIVSQAKTHYNAAGEARRRIGSEVHQGSRILAVADAYDSLANDQTYRQGLEHVDILNVLMDSAGTRYDGNVVCALARWSEQDDAGFGQLGGEFGQGGEVAPGPVQVEETLEASSAAHVCSYVHMVESMYDGFHVVDADSNFAVWSPKLEAFLGRSWREALGESWSQRVLGYADIDGVPLPENECPVHQVRTSRQPVTAKAQLMRGDGRAIDVEIQAVPILDSSGELRGVAEIFRDLSRSERRPQEVQELQIAASRDALTSVANRGELERQLAVLADEFQRTADAPPFSLIFLDVDFFKNINDTFGHAAGDQVLIDVARLLQHETYSGELVGRYGGEEFVILCPDTDLEQAVRRAERLRHALQETEVADLKGYKLTASFGVTQAEPGDTVEDVLKRADMALYQAKETGRNKTRSLTNAELQPGEPEAESEERHPLDPFVYAGSFYACIAADMVVYKLGGFVTDHGAVLTEVTPSRAVVRLGRRGMLPLWGASDASRPVRMEIEFGSERPHTASHISAASRQVAVNVRIRPVGWVRKADAFQRRAKRIMKTLREYFVAD